jgi:biopolymer transport protein ExbD
MSATATASLHSASEPNVTPMLDVLLVLLIIFMSVVVQVHHTLDIQLPEACASACASGDAIVLEVRSGPEYHLNHTPIPTGLLGQRLSDIYRDRPNKVLQLAGYPGATYQQVIHAMDVARGSGVRVVAIAPKESYVTH